MHNSEKVARALFISLCRYAAKVGKQDLTPAEKRHLFKLRTIKAIRDANWELDKEVTCATPTK